MSSPDDLLALFKERGIVCTKQVYEAKIPTIYLTRLVRSGYIERVSAATYVLAGRTLTEDAILAEIADTMMRGVASLETAAAYFGLSAHPRNQAYVSFPRGHAPPIRRAFAIHAFREGLAAYGAGWIERRAGRGTVRIYGPAKTVADFFKYRGRLGIERALAILHAYRWSEYWDLDALDRYARIDQVDRVLQPYLEALEAFSVPPGTDDETDT